jgi:hypothetical protein
LCRISKFFALKFLLDQTSPMPPPASANSAGAG